MTTPLPSIGTQLISPAGHEYEVAGHYSDGSHARLQGVFNGDVCDVHADVLAAEYSPPDANPYTLRLDGVGPVDARTEQLFRRTACTIGYGGGVVFLRFCTAGRRSHALNVLQIRYAGEDVTFTEGTIP